MSISLRPSAVRTTGAGGGESGDEPGRSVRSRLLGSPEILAVISMLVLWEGVPRLFPSDWLPPLSAVIKALGELAANGELGEALLSSLFGLLIGFVVSVVFGIPIGLLMGRSRMVEAALDVYVSAALFTPSLILAPVFFAIFGLGPGTRICVIIAYTMPILIVNTSVGIRTVTRDLPDMAYSFGLTQIQSLRHVYIPAARPMLLEGIRLGIGRSIKGMINGETFIAFAGLGGIAAAYGARLDSAKVFAITLVVLIAAIGLNWIFTRFERRTLAYL